MSNIFNIVEISW